MQKTIITKETPLSTITELAPPCRCSQCSHGCTMGSGFLAQDDVHHLAQFLGITEEQLKKEHLEEVKMFNKALFRPKLERKDGKPYGKCTFYDPKKGCTVHPAKPLQCKIAMGCKDYGEKLHAWFVLNHLVNNHDPESIREYAVYLKSGGAVIDGGQLHELVPDAEMLHKILSYKVLR